jgi:hypothetical protein
MVARFLEVLERDQRKEVLGRLFSDTNFKDKYTDCKGDAKNFQDELGGMVDHVYLEELMNDLDFADENSEDR